MTLGLKELPLQVGPFGYLTNGIHGFSLSSVKNIDSERKAQVHDYIADERMAEISMGLPPTCINPARHPAAYVLKTKH